MSRSRCMCGRACATTKQIARSTNNVGEQTNQFDKTGVDFMCDDTTAATTLS